MTRIDRARGTLVLALLLSAAGCGGDRAGARGAGGAAGPPADVVIGAPWPWAARRDFLYDQGVRMAVDEVNAAGGVGGRRLRIERFDDLESVDEGRLVAQRLAAERTVDAVIGHMQSYVTVPAAAVYDAAGLVLVAPTSTDAGLTSRGYRRVFRVMFSDRDAGREMAELAKTLGVTRAGIFYIRNSYGRALANAFEVRAKSAGIDVIDRQSYDPGSQTEAQLDEIVRVWKERRVDGVFLAAEAGPAARFAREIRRQGLSAVMLGGDALGTPELFAEGAEAVRGLIIPAPFHADEPREQVRRFAAEFRRRYGRPPDALAALGYDAVRVLAHAMTTARSTAPDSVARALHALRDWSGVTGTFSYDDAGDLPTKRIVKVVARDSAFVYLDDSKPLRAAAIASAR